MNALGLDFFWSSSMKILAILSIISGMIPTLLILQIAHSDWTVLGMMSVYAIVPNPLHSADRLSDLT
jgi:hypothetical protein